MNEYKKHHAELIERYQDACIALGLDSILVSSGELTYYANDDISHPFKPNPFCQQWLPYDVAANTYVLFQLNKPPILYWPDKQDFWHVVPNEPTGQWTECWQIEPASKLSLPLSSTRCGCIGNDVKNEKYFDKTINKQLFNYLGYGRAYKTNWEISQLQQANEQAVLGHHAAREVFLSGASEFEIHQAYLNAAAMMQNDEPYGSIVGVNESAAILHYELKQRVRLNTNRSLLIDAGSQKNGYASDITRTYCSDNGTFANLITQLDNMQLALCSACKSGVQYQAIHEQALEAIALILNESGICTLSVEEQLIKQIPQVFFPHGVGHLLGLQVHDIGGKQIDRNGNVLASPEHAPFLRMTRVLENNMAFTIEPGLYFIPMLLEKMEQTIKAHGCDMDLVKSLIPYGGIRIEDNVVIKNDRSINLTRNAFTSIRG